MQGHRPVTLLRRAGTHPRGWTPDQRRTTPQERRAAPHPGNVCQLVRFPRRRRQRPRLRAAILDGGDHDAEPFDGADHLAVEIVVAIYLRRRDEEIRLLPGW